MEMRLKHTTTLSLTTMLLLVFCAARTDAHLCGTGTVCAAYRDASAVFVGTVSEHTFALVAPAVDSSVTAPIRGKIETIRFTVTEVFKGAQATEIVVENRLGDGIDRGSFKPGDRYLVFANRDAQTGAYYLDRCPRIWRFSLAGGDLEYLRGLPDSATRTRISGFILRVANEPDQEYPPMVGVRVLITGDGQSFEAFTNNDGNYQRTDLPPGRYRVKVEVPDTLEARDQLVEVSPGGCGEANFIALPTGRIGGTVLDSWGNAAPSAKVQLLFIGKAPEESDGAARLRPETAYADEVGHYEFQGISPGRYYLGVTLDQEPQGEFPYPRTYFPGTPEREKATVIVLGDGETLGGYDLQLPPALSVRKLEGIFVSSDGRPVESGNVLLAASPDPKKKGRIYASARVGEQGRFILQGFDGVECWLHGSIYSMVGDRMTFVDIEPIKILVTDEMKPIKLVAPVPTVKEKKL